MKNVDQMLIVPHKLFYGKRMLTPDVEEFLIEEAEKYSNKAAIHLKFYLSTHHLDRSQEVETAVHQHFGRD